MTVTIFIRLEEDASCGWKYKPCVFRGVHVETQDVKSHAGSEERSNDIFRLYIFTKRGYLPKDEFLKDPKNHWTLKPMDLLALGMHSEVPKRPYHINTVNEVYKEDKFHHWEVRGSRELE